MSLKNVVTSAVFAVIGFVISMVAGMATGALGTMGMYVHSALAALLEATVFIVLCHKTGMRGSAFIYYAIPALVYLLMGMPPMAFIALAAAVVAELVLLGGGYDSNLRIAISFILSSLVVAAHGYILLSWLGVQGLVDQFPGMFTPEAAQSLYDFYFEGLTILAVMGIHLVAELIGLALGFFIDKKYFSANKSASALD